MTSYFLHTTDGCEFPQRAPQHRADEIMAINNSMTPAMSSSEFQAIETSSWIKPNHLIAKYNHSDFNALPLWDAIKRHSSWWTLPRVTVCCPTTQSQNVNECSLQWLDNYWGLFNGKCITYCQQMHEKVYLQEFFSYHPGAKAFNPNET